MVFAHLLELRVDHVEIVLLGVLVAAHLLLDRLQLLVEEVFPLVLLRRLLDPRLQVLLQLHQLQLRVEHFHAQIQTLAHRARFQQLSLTHRARSHLLEVFALREGHVPRQIREVERITRAAVFLLEGREELLVERILRHEQIHVAEKLVRIRLHRDLIEVLAEIGELGGFYDHWRALLHHAVNSNTRQTAHNETGTVAGHAEVAKFGAAKSKTIGN